jgi:hypothetical protein
MKTIIATCLLAGMFLVSSHSNASGPPEGAGPPADRGPPAFAGRPDFAGVPANLRERERPDRGRPDFARPPIDPSTMGQRRGMSRAGVFTPLPGQAGASHVSHVRFAILDEDGEPVADTSWGRMTWFWIGPSFDFLVNGHELEGETDYVLVSLPPEHDAEGVSWCLAQGSSNPDGHLILLGSLELDSHIPANLDPDAILNAEAGAEAPEGALFAIVAAAEVTCSEQEEGGPDLASFGDGADSDAWLVSIRDVHYIDSDLLDDGEEEEEEDGGED